MKPDNLKFEDDPRLTAYALGEGSAEERAGIERELAQSAEARAFVCETGAFAEKLSRELRGERGAELNAEQKERVCAAFDESQKIARPASGRSALRIPLWLKIAACVLFAVFLAGLFFPALNSVNEFARRVQQQQPAEKKSQTADAENFPSNIAAPGAATTPAPALLAQNEYAAEAAPAKDERAKQIALAKPLADMPAAELKALEAAPGGANQPAQPSLDASSSVNVNAGTLASRAPVDVPASKPAPLFGSELTRSRLAENKASDASAASAPVAPPLPRGAAATLGGPAPRMEARATASSRKLSGRNAYTGSVALAQSDEALSKSPQFALQQERQAATRGDFNTAGYSHFVENPFLAVRENPLSTFSIDVDTASYANVRRFLNSGTRPPTDAVRIEELVNYFRYDYPQPEGDAPFSVNVEINDCPWNPGHRLARIGLRGREIPTAQRPASNLVFLIDVSGSMMPENRLPLLKQSLRALAENLTERDRVSIVVYAGASGLVLPPTSGADKGPILAALASLEAGGSTNGAAGIELAYTIATQNFIKGGINRVILATDGDFNVGTTSESELVRLIEKKRESGVFLSVLGVGDDNLKDSQMKKLADHGNGNYAYIDSLAEGKRVLVEQAGGTLVTIAKDVKIQVEFNPAAASAYRLIGYEHRLLRKEDFNDDKKDAGEIGSGHTVTALYEIVPAGGKVSVPGVDPLKYQPAPQSVQTEDSRAVSAETVTVSSEMMTVKLRYKQPDGDTSKLLQVAATDAGKHLADSSRDFRFAAAVAEFGMLLRDSEFKGSATFDGAREIAVEGKGEDPNGRRAEFISLIDKANRLWNPRGEEGK